MSKNKLTFKLKSEKFQDFISKLEELSKIKDIIKLKIDAKEILMYSMVGESAILAFKSYIVNTQDYFDIKDLEDFNYSLDMVILNSKKVIKSLSFFVGKQDVKGEFSHVDPSDNDDLRHVRSFTLKDSKLTIPVIGGELFKIRDISKGILKQRLDLKNSKWSFKISKAYYGDIRKLSSINSDNKIINIDIKSGQVCMSESNGWQLVVDEVDPSQNKNIMMNKKYLSTIVTDDLEDNINFHIFDSFMLTKNDNSNLMLSFEQSFEDDDD